MIDGRVRIEQVEVYLALRQIDPAQAHPDRITHLPTPSRAAAYQAHPSLLELPIVAGDGRDMHQPIDGHLLQLHE